MKLPSCHYTEMDVSQEKHLLRHRLGTGNFVSELENQEHKHISFLTFGILHSRKGRTAISWIPTIEILCRWLMLDCDLK